MAVVEWTTPAVNQLEEIVEYHRERSPSYAERVGNQITTAVDRLESLPLMGRVVPEFKIQTIRELIVSPYRILYHVRGETCSVIAVVDSRRDFTRVVRLEDLDLE